MSIHNLSFQGEIRINWKFKHAFEGNHLIILHMVIYKFLYKNNFDCSEKLPLTKTAILLKSKV